MMNDDRFPRWHFFVNSKTVKAKNMKTVKLLQHSIIQNKFIVVVCLQFSQYLNTLYK